MRGYRGYTIEVDILRTNTAVFIVSFRGEEVDRFLTLDDAVKTIDEWKVAP